MNVKRYFARTAREALRALKEELGAEAIVLANRAVEGGVEILALPAGAVGAMQATAQSPAPRSAPGDHEREVRPTDVTKVAPSGVQRRTPPTATLSDAQSEPRRAQIPTPDMPSAPARGGAEELARIKALEASNGQLMSELAAIRALVERQLAGFAWGETSRQAPARAQLLGELLETGFSSVLARRLVDEVAEEASPAEGRASVKRAIERQLRALDSDADIIDRGGVYALVGPTGVGKTTTTAKLAARCVVRHGAGKLALITTDGYRIGAHEQLRIYGRILGVPVFTVRDATELRQTLAELKKKHMVLIDTVGVSQRDRMVAEQAAMLLGAGEVGRLLLLNATCRGDTLDDVIRAYRGEELAGCILSKVDEAASLAPALDAVLRHDLELFYVTNGQRVPEDLHLPNRAQLLYRALRELPPDSPYRLSAEEASLILAGSGRGD
jgi:flagellar biosynthesis protein FlhF